MIVMNVNANTTFEVGKLQFLVLDDGKSVLLNKLVTGQTVSGDLYIPQIVNDGDRDYTVVGISASAFYKQTELRSVYIPNTVKYIFMTAFYGCTNLSSISFPDNLEVLGYQAFDKTAWFEAEPDGPVYVGNTFYVYKNGKKIMPAGTNLVIRDGTTTIANNALDGCANLTGVQIPSSVTTIGNQAFNRCTGLTYVAIPNTVKNVGSGLFQHCTSLVGVTLPNSMTYIPYGLFYDCKALQSVSIPAGVETIFGVAFSGCTSLANVTIPDKVKAIGTRAFYGCTGLTDITVPASVRYIDQDVFANTAWLNNQPDGIVYNGNVAYTYKGTPSGILTIKEGTTAIANQAFMNCTGITVLRLPNSLMYIGSESFSGCSSLTYLNLPGNVKAIGNYTFQNCTNLTEISFPNSLMMVGIYNSGLMAFSGTQWFNEQPDGVVYAGPVAIGYKGRITDDGVVTVKEGTKAIANNGVGSSPDKVILPNSVTTIGPGAFTQCSYLKEINIPQSVTSIGWGALTSISRVERIDAYVDPANVKLGDDALIMGMPQIEDYYSPVSKSRCFYISNAYGRGMDDCVLHVLPGKEERFANALCWARFKNIVGDLSEGDGEPGDVDGNGVVNGSDVTALYNLLLNGAQPVGNADVDGNGTINGSDVTALYNLLLQ